MSNPVENSENRKAEILAKSKKAKKMKVWNMLIIEGAKLESSYTLS